MRKEPCRKLLAGFAGILLAGTGWNLAASAQTAGHPDFSGSYMMRAGPGQPATSGYQLTPEGQRLYDRNRAAVAAGDAEIDTALKCWPTGFPRMLFGPLPFYFLQTPKAIGIIAETDPLPRLIYLDSDHRKEYWPTYMGDSVAHWEGNVLVIDTVNLTTKTFTDMRGLPHSGALHIVERMELVNDGKTLQDFVTIDDPNVFKAPWTQTYAYDRRDDLKPVENVCENTRDRP